MKQRKHESFMNSSNDTRIAILENTLNHFGETLHRIENHLFSIDRRIDALDQKFETKIDALDKKFEAKIDTLDKKFEKKFDTLDNRIWMMFFWITGGFASVLGLVAHALHWI